jgi:hypothetical protein
MVAGFIVRASNANVGTPVLATGGLLSAIGAYTFAYIIWRTIDAPKVESVVRPTLAVRKPT